jgi:hypothetical protein
VKRGDGKDETLEEPQHPPIEILLAMTGETPAPGEPAADKKSIEHVSNCPTCGELFQELQAWRDAVRRGDAGNAPEAWVRRAQERAVPRSFLGPMSGRFQAEVVFDSGLTLAAGTRADALQGRQWVLAIDRLEIELSIAAAEAVEAPPLSGQVLQVEGAPVTLGNCRVVMVEGERNIAETKTIETGEFLFRKRPSGAFQLRLEGDGWSILTPVLEA